MNRTAQHAIEPIFVSRWSPRAMSGEGVDREALLRLIEAARWAPSASNRQPTRYVFAHRETPAFDAIFGALNEGNQAWNTRAGAFIVVLSRTVTDEGRPIPSHAFDAGAGWMSLALQGSTMGLVVHAMGGFDKERLGAALSLPDDVAVHVVVAVGRPGRVEDLPGFQQAREKPSDRLPVSAIAFEGQWGGV